MSCHYWQIKWQGTDHENWCYHRVYQSCVGILCKISLLQGGQGSFFLNLICSAILIFNIILIFLYNYNFLTSYNFHSELPLDSNMSHLPAFSIGVIYLSFSFALLANISGQQHWTKLIKGFGLPSMAERTVCMQGYPGSLDIVIQNRCKPVLTLEPLKKGGTLRLGDWKVA